jgi:hypothetical protein
MQGRTLLQEGLATSRGARQGSTSLGPSERAKQEGFGNLETTPNTFDKALIAQKSQAGGMATYGSRCFIWSRRFSIFGLS